MATKKKASPKTSTCAVCGTSIPYPARGRPRKYCDAHAPSQNRRRDAKQALIDGDHDRAQTILSAIGGGGSVNVQKLPPSVRAAMLAVGLSVHSNRSVAAELVGLEREPDLKHLERLARDLWPEIIEGDSGPLHSMLEASLKLTALNSVVDAKSVKPDQRAVASQRAAQTLRELQNFATAFAGPVRVVWEETDDAT